MPPTPGKDMRTLPEGPRTAPTCVCVGRRCPLPLSQKLKGARRGSPDDTKRKPLSLPEYSVPLTARSAGFQFLWFLLPSSVLESCLLAPVRAQAAASSLELLLKASVRSECLSWSFTALPIQHYLFPGKMVKAKQDRKARNAINEVVTREYTIHMHKRIKGMWVLRFRLSQV